MYLVVEIVFVKQDVLKKNSRGAPLTFNAKVLNYVGIHMKRVITMLYYTVKKNRSSEKREVLKNYFNLK